MAMVPHEPCNPTRGAPLLLSFLGAKVASMLKHGHSRDSGESPTYRSWVAMIQRCYDEDATSYDPANCKWSTVKEQNRNRRSTRWVEFMGRTMSLAEAIELSGLPEARVKRRLYVYKWTVDEALAAR